MSEAYLSIIAMAIKIKMGNGSTFEESVAPYKKLTESDITTLKEMLNVTE